MVSSTFVSISFASTEFQKLFATFVPPKLASVGCSSAHVQSNKHVVTVGGLHSTQVAFTLLTLRPLVRIPTWPCRDLSEIVFAHP